MTKGSLRLRLFLAAAISIAIALFLTGLALVRLFEDQVRERVLTGLENDLLQLAGSINVAKDGSVTAGRALADPRYQEPYGGRYWRIDFIARRWPAGDRAAAVTVAVGLRLRSPRPEGPRRRDPGGGQARSVDRAQWQEPANLDARCRA